MTPAALLALACTVLVGGCALDARSGADPEPSEQRGTVGVPSPGPDRSTATTAPAPTTSGPSAVPAPTSTTAGSAGFDSAAAYDVVVRLARGIGPREAASPAFRRAATVVADQFVELGFDVRRQDVPVPAGVSWGVTVRAGTTQNVIATLPGFRPDRPHRLVGAHLDTVPQAPGAEDNASGVGVLLELARLVSLDEPEVPVVLVAFGGEEPRGPGDALHHFGSRRMVATMDDEQREALLGMLSLDRVGVRNPTVPVCSAGGGPSVVRAELLRLARSLQIAADRCVNRASDHWSFAKAGVPAARLGSVPYAAYHSPADRPRVVDRRQLDAVGRLAAAWVRSPS